MLCAKNKNFIVAVLEFKKFEKQNEQPSTRSGKTRYSDRLPKCPRIFIIPKAMQGTGPRAGNDLGYFARDGARL